MKPDYFIIAAAIFSTFFSVWKVKQIVDDENKRLGRIYERIDIVKENLKKELVVRELCDVKYVTMQQNVMRLENKFDDGFKCLDAKMAVVLQKLNGRGP